ncbi:hypothetical protein [Bacillus sp. REN16]|uniref:hypothetical protein n=1 Tax=Bacillus sp. REN16 TaxID=2887296 RepID=UPI001E60FE08|nr:hypothetical protein [Bacillus sp. REN16]MCC3356136.1 hypothetical protein [Bacillus sp. REN16]
MKSLRVIFLLVIMLSFIGLSIQQVYAEDVEPTVDKATIDIQTNDENYHVNETITLKGLEGVTDGRVEHFVRKTGLIKNIKITSENQEIPLEVTEGDELDRYFVQIPASNSEMMEYTIEYEVVRVENEFEVPLFVPAYKSQNDRAVHVTFTAPEGNVVQKNSFPVVLESGHNQIEKDMTNIPVYAKYVFYEKNNSWNSFTIISVISILSILLLLAVWAISEKRKSKGGANYGV